MARDLYDRKKGRARQVYRTALAEITTATDRQAVLDRLLASLARAASAGDREGRTLKLAIPPALDAALDQYERRYLGQALDLIRQERGVDQIMVYPPSADEFALDGQFLDLALGAARLPLFSRKSRIKTLGSCFAVNIAKHLEAQGYQATNFRMAEQLNSPLSNAIMLEAAAMPDSDVRLYSAHWAQVFDIPQDLAENAMLAAKRMAMDLAEADLIIFTLGNVMDFAMPDGALAPKFMLNALPDDQIAHQIGRTMAGAGARLMLMPEPQVVQTLRRVRRLLLGLAPEAPVVFTVSPVPIASAQGLTGSSPPQSSIEADALSKSRLRSAVAQVLDFEQMDAGRGLPPCHYFPSYEIVRWIAPQVMAPLFGAEDSSSRHVSQAVLIAVFDYFIRRHGPVRE